MKGAEDFLLVVRHSHIISAAKNILSNSDVQSVTTLVEKIIKNFVRITIPTVVCADSDKSTDQVHTYATELLTLAMLWHNFHDASKEGDGDRLIRCWKFLLLVFKASRRKNYSIEALNLLLQVGHLLSPREAEQVKWSRCINTSGQPGCNMPMDLHMEHLNRRVKNIISNMGSNIKNTSIALGAQIVHIVDNICGIFERENESNLISGKHSLPSFKADFNLILETLQDQEVFSIKQNRKHNSFNFKCSLFENQNKAALVKWIKQTTNKLL